MIYKRNSSRENNKTAKPWIGGVPYKRNLTIQKNEINTPYLHDKDENDITCILSMHAWALIVHPNPEFTVDL